MSDAIWPDDPHGDCGEVRVVAVAPQTASAAKLKKAYDGRVATQGVDGQTPTIQLKVQFRRKDGKLVPYYLANLKHPRDSPRAEGIADLLQLTIRLVTTDPTQGRCDSGTVSYTAPRGGQLQSSPVGVEAKRTSGAELCSIGGTITGAVLLAYSRRRSDSTPGGPAVAFEQLQDAVRVVPDRACTVTPQPRPATSVVRLGTKIERLR